MTTLFFDSDRINDFLLPPITPARMNIHKKIKKTKVLYQTGQYSELEAFCKKHLRKHRNDPQILHFLGLAQERLGQIDKAIATLELAVSIKKDYGDAYRNLGHLCLLAQRIEDAIKASNYAISLEPNNAGAYNNLGNAHLMNRSYKDAEKAYLQALKRDPKKGLYLDNLGVCLVRQGRMSDAVTQFLRANELHPSLSSVYINLFQALMFMHNTEDASRVIDLGLCSGVLQAVEVAELLVGKAKIAWITGKLLEARETIDKSRTIHTEFNSGSNVDNLRRFHRYIDLLLVERGNCQQLYEGAPQKAIFFVAESHCLTASEVVVGYQGESHRILSSLITGCKAWHLSRESDNEYKTSLTLLFMALPSQTSVVLGFGEIDCRSSGGILKAHHAGKANYQLSVPNFLEKYVEFACRKAAPYQHNLIFYGVPAPSTYILSVLCPEEVELLCSIVKLFNEELRNICWQRQLDFLDVHSATSDSSGQSNMKYHIDSHHLHPQIIPILFDSYLISK